MGSNYVAYTAALTTTTDLTVVQLTVDSSARRPACRSETVTFTVKARIANSGNTVAAQSAIVRFFDKDPAQGGVQIGRIKR